MPIGTPENLERKNLGKMAVRMKQRIPSTWCSDTSTYTLKTETCTVNLSTSVFGNFDFELAMTSGKNGKCNGIR